MSRISDVTESYGSTLSFRPGETVRGEDWSKKKLGRIVSSAALEGCRFDGTSAKQVRLGGAGWTAEFLDCSFDNARLKMIGTQARFINCTFRNARLTDFRVNPVALVNCDFSGAVLRKCQFWGGPTAYDLKKRRFLNLVNEFHGNDFSTAIFDDTSFRGGVDLTRQNLPVGKEYALALDGNAALQRAAALVDSWGPEREKDRRPARFWIEVWGEDVQRSQEHLFVVWPKKRISEEGWLELREVINGD